MPTNKNAGPKVTPVKEAIKAAVVTPAPKLNTKPSLENRPDGQVNFEPGWSLPIE